MSLANEINQVLTHPINHIQRTHFSESEWFHEVNEDNETISFGGKEGKHFTISFLSHNVLDMSQGYKLPNDIGEQIRIVIQDYLIKEDLSFFILHKNGTSATSKRTRPMKQLYDYAFTHLKKEERSLRVPYYAILPASSFKGGITISNDLNDQPLLFEEETFSLLRAFVKQDKYDEEKMIQQEQRLTDWVTAHTPNTRKLPSGESITTYIVNDEEFCLTFAFRKVLENKEVSYLFEYSFENGGKRTTIKHVELDELCSIAESIIQTHIQSHYPLKQSTVSNERANRIHTFYSSMSDEELRNKLQQAGFVIIPDKNGKLILEENN